MIKLQIWWNKGLKKWRIILCSGIAKANTVKMSVFLTWCTTLKQSLLKSQGSYFVDIDRLTQKFIWRDRRFRIANIILKKKVWGLTLPDFAAAAKSLQSWPTLCDPIDGSPPGSSIPGILQGSQRGVRHN